MENNIMKLSDFTLQILENFANINEGIVILKDNTDDGGTQIRTLAPDGSSITASVIVPDTFANDICISDLKPFLNVVKITNDPSLDFEERQVKITGDNLTTTITYARQSEVIHEYARYPKLKGDIVSFSLTHQNLHKLLKLADTLQLSQIVVGVENNKVVLSATDPLNPDGKSVHVIVGEGVGTENASFLPLRFPRSVFRFIEGTYDVGVCNGLAKFTNAETKLEYIITPLV